MNAFSVNIYGPDKCEECDGDGKCPDCSGDGECAYCYGLEDEDRAQCADCRGSGECDRCESSGKCDWCEDDGKNLHQSILCSGCESTLATPEREAGFDDKCERCEQSPALLVDDAIQTIQAQLRDRPTDCIASKREGLRRLALRILENL